MKSRLTFALLMFALVTLACSVSFGMENSGGSANPGSSVSVPPPTGGETATVTRVIDGDTIEVNLNGQRYTVRYVGVNTPERDEPCYAEARDANRALVENRTVTLVRDVSNTDRFDRLLRYVYVGDTLVNAALVQQGWAEKVEYPPDTRLAAEFGALEAAARTANLGCHPTGIFDDGSSTR